MPTINIPQGSNLSTIAQQYGTTVQDLVNLNQNNPGALPNPSNPDLILEGGNLNVPGATQTTPPAPTPEPSPTADIDTATTEPESEPTPSPFDFSQFEDEQTDADRALEDRFRNFDPNRTVDANQIRQQTMSMFQGQIDAINNIYNNLVNEARIEGVGRLGSSRAIRARRGLLGSEMGQAQKEGVISYNQRIQNKINAERQNKIAAVMSMGRIRADARIAEERAALEKESDAYMEYLQGKDEKRSSDANNIVQAMIAQGLSIEDMEQDDVEQLANDLDITPQELITLYNGQSAEFARENEDEDETEDLTGTTANFRTFRQFFPEGTADDFQEFLQETSASGRRPTTPKAPKPPKDTDLHFGTLIVTQAKITEGRQLLESTRATAGDGFIDPNVYLELYNDWLSEGGPVEGFFDMFPPESYINPANRNLPEIIMNRVRDEADFEEGDGAGLDEFGRPRSV